MKTGDSSSGQRQKVAVKSRTVFSRFQSVQEVTDAHNPVRTNSDRKSYQAFVSLFVESPIALIVTG